jgi:hypothetical protein
VDLSLKVLSYLALAAGAVLVALIVTVGVLLPVIWSRNPRRRKAAKATLKLLLDQTRRIAQAIQNRPSRKLR